MYNPNILNVQLRQLRQGKSFNMNCVRQLGVRDEARRGVTEGSLGLKQRTS